MSPETIILIVVYVMLCAVTLCGVCSVLYAQPKNWAAWWCTKNAVDRTRRRIREEHKDDDR